MAVSSFPELGSCASSQDMEAYGFPLPFLDDDGSAECPPGFVSSASPGQAMLLNF